MNLTRQQRYNLQNAVDILERVGAVYSAEGIKKAFPEAFVPERPELDEIQINEPEPDGYQRPSLFKTLKDILTK